MTVVQFGSGSAAGSGTDAVVVLEQTQALAGAIVAEVLPLVLTGVSSEARSASAYYGDETGQVPGLELDAGTGIAPGPAASIAAGVGVGPAAQVLAAIAHLHCVGHVAQTAGLLHEPVPVARV